MQPIGLKPFNFQTLTVWSSGISVWHQVAKISELEGIATGGSKPFILQSLTVWSSGILVWHQVWGLGS